MTGNAKYFKWLFKKQLIYEIKVFETVSLSYETKVLCNNSKTRIFCVIYDTKCVIVV